MTTTARQAEPGERCTCGRPALTVFSTERYGEVGWCGASDGGERAGPCPFCGGGRHEGRCPQYRLRSDPQPPAEGLSSPGRSMTSASSECQGAEVNVTHLHRDDAPLTLRLLDGLFGHRHDRAEIGYRPDQWGAVVDWDRLTGGVLSTSEVAVVHMARGCAIAERHGGPLPPSVRGPLRAAINDLAPGNDRPVIRPGRRPRRRVVRDSSVELNDVPPPAPGVDL
jgi:hypothetical protein